MDKWEMESAPMDTPQARTYKLYQGDTVKWGECSKDKEKLNGIITITVYKDVPYIEVEMKNNKMSFKVPKDVVKDILK
ncbi:putative lipoprotein [Bacillus clarus]|uniref:Putative lipoprotein n=1 Tax=Bacillus clarus TaxID=2338372 RepID=A0A090YSE8_9BACI|nr:putative lipoprotein [Bacillus clarus]